MAEQNETTDGRSPPGRPSLFSNRLRWRSVLAGLAVFASVPTWLSLGARWSWLLDLATCFVWWYAAGLVVMLIVVSVIRRRRIALLMAIALAVNLVQLAPYTPVPGAAAPGASPRLRVMTLNVLTANRSHAAVLDLIRHEAPDVVALLEVDQAWSEAMAPLAASHPHFKTATRSDNFGVALYSRVPTNRLEVRELTRNGTPTAIAELTWNDRPLTIIAAHPAPPMSLAGATSRNADLAAFARLAGEAPGEAILMGDLNVTPFSPHFHDLMKAGRLRDSAAGRGLFATWGTPRLGLVLPIDHVLISAGLGVIDRRVGPKVGSDHRAVIVDLVLSGDKTGR